MYTHIHSHTTYISCNLVLLFLCGIFQLKSSSAGQKCGLPSLLSEEQLVWLTDRFAETIHSPQFHLTLPSTVAFNPLSQTEHTLKYKSEESHHIRSPTLPCTIINHKYAVPIILSPCVFSLHSLPCILPWKRYHISFLNNLLFQWLNCIIFDNSRSHEVQMMVKVI